MTADDLQVSGDHYKTDYQHWNWILALGFGSEYYIGQATKYLTRWRKKNGLRDLLKGQHFIEKLLEIVEQRGDTFLHFGHISDEDIRPIILDHLNSHLQHYIDVNQIDSVTASLIIGVSFANNAQTLREVLWACKELAAFEERSGGGTKADLEVPVSQKFDFLGYVDGGSSMNWRCKRCSKSINLAMNQPPALAHVCAVVSTKVAG